MKTIIFAIAAQVLAVAICVALFVASRSPLTLLCAILNACFLAHSAMCVIDMRRNQRRMAELKRRIAAS